MSKNKNRRPIPRKQSNSPKLKREKEPSGVTMSGGKSLFMMSGDVSDLEGRFSYPEKTSPRPLKEWEPIQEHLDVIKELVEGAWKWYYNTDCKYVDIRVDMRDGCAIMLDRYGRPIDFDQLRHQYTDEENTS